MRTSPLVFVVGAVTLGDNRRPISQSLSLFEELKRRKVFQVAAMYAIVGWLLIQVADASSGNLNLPDWSITLIIVLVIAGFPLALVLAWAYDITPDQGLAKTQDPITEDQRTTQAVVSTDFVGLGSNQCV